MSVLPFVLGASRRAWASRGALLLVAWLAITGAASAQSVFFWSSSSATTTENAAGGVVNLTLQRSGNTAASATCILNSANGTALAGTDYGNILNQQVIFAPGQTSSNITVAILQDATPEVAETFLVNISTVAVEDTLGTAGSITVTITDDDAVVSFASATTNIFENAAGNNVDLGLNTVTIQLVRTFGSVGALTVQVNAVGGTAQGTALATTNTQHYINTIFPITVNFPDGVVNASFNMQLINNSTNNIPTTPTIQLQLVAGAETPVLNATGPGVSVTAGTQNSTVSILDDEASSGVLTITPRTFPNVFQQRVVQEGAITIEFQINRNFGSGGNIAVEWFTADLVNYASLPPSTMLYVGSDYSVPGLDHVATSGTVTFGAGDTTPKIIQVTLLDDGANPQPEHNKDIIVSLNGGNPRVTDVPPMFPNPTIGNVFVQDQGSASVTILDDDQPGGALHRGWNVNGSFATVPPNISLPGPNNFVYGIGLDTAGRGIVVGDFTDYNTVPVNRVVRIATDGAYDSTYNTGQGADSFVAAVAVYASGTNADKAVVVGAFTAFDGVSRNRIARLNANGSLDTTFNPGAGFNGTVRAVAIQPDGRIVVGGSFTSFNGVNTTNVARLMHDGSLDTSFIPGGGANDTVYAVAVDAAGNIYFGGDFTTYAGVSRSRIARAITNGSLDTVFDPGTGCNGTVHAIGVQSDSRVVLGGAFTTFNQTSRPRVARLTTLGALDSTFDPGSGANNTVQALAVQPNDQVVLAGSFISFDGTSRTNLLRLRLDGSLDTSFMDPVFNTFAGPTNSVTGVNGSFLSALAIQTDGNILIGGSFNRIGAAYQATPYVTVPTGDNRTNAPNDNLPANFTTAQINAAKVRWHQIAPRQNLARVVGRGTTAPGNVEFEFANNSIGESSGSSTVRVRRSNGQTGPAVTPYTTIAGSATAGVDFQSTANSVFWAGPGNMLSVYETGIINNVIVANNSFIAVPIIGDTTVEGDENLSIRLSTPSGSFNLGTAGLLPVAQSSVTPVISAPALGFQRTTTLTITDDDFPRGVFGFTTTNFTVLESAGNAVISVARVNGSVGAVSVNYASSAGTATAPPSLAADYSNVSGTLSFLSGETNKTFTVPIVNDTAVENDETITLVLSNPTGGATLNNSIIPTVATLSIIDDDFPAGRIGFSLAAYTVSETAGSVTVNVNRTGGSVGAASAVFRTVNGTAASGTHYTGVTNNLSWGSGDTSTRAITIPVFDNFNIEGTLTVDLLLTNFLGSVGGNFTNVVLSIVDDDTPGTLAFSSPSYAITENGGVVTITVVRSGGRGGPVSVDYSTPPGTAIPYPGAGPAAGSDYTNASGTLQLGPGVTSASFTIGVIDNSLTNLNKTVGLVLSNPTNATLRFGAIDPQFNAPGVGVNGLVRAVVAYTSGTNAGKFIIVGDFTGVNGVTNNRVARINPDGSVDQSFAIGAGANATVRAVAIEPGSGKVLLGGDFTTFGATTVRGAVQLDQSGAVDVVPVDLGAGTVIHAVAYDGANYVLGGAFIHASATNLVRLTAAGAVDVGFTVTGGPVRALLVDGTNYVLGGDFTSVESTTRLALAKVSTNRVLSAFNAALTGGGPAVHALELDGTNYVIGGSFTNVGGISRSNIARVLPAGGLDSSFNPGSAANGLVRALARDSSGRVVVGGDFTSFNGTARARLARLAANGTVDAAFNTGGSGADAAVHAVGLVPVGANTHVVVGGDFYTFNNVVVNHLARLNSGATALDADFNLGRETTTGVITGVLRQPDGRLLIVGTFTSYNGITRNRIARLNPDGTLDANFDAAVGPNGTIESVAVDNSGRVLLGGSFTGFDGAITSKAFTNNVGTITTSTPHGFPVGAPVTISSVDNIFNGTWTVVSVPSANTFSFTRTNFHNLASRSLTNGNATFFTTTPHNLTLNQTVTVVGLDPVFNGQYVINNVDDSTRFIAARTYAATVVGKAFSGGTATLTTRTPHGLVAGSTVTLGGVGSGLDGGTFSVLTVPSSVSFTIASALTNTVTSKVLAGGLATLTTGTAHNLAAGDTVVVTGVDALFDGTYTLTNGTAGSTLVYARPHVPVVNAVSYTNGTTTATLTTATPHNLAAGNVVTVTGVNGTFNGTYTVLGSNSPTVFTVTRANSVGLSTVQITTNRATFTPLVAHRFAAGNTVTLSGLVGSLGAALNGTYVIATVPSATNFSVDLTPISVAVTARELTGNLARLTAPGHLFSVGQTVVVNIGNAAFDGTNTITAVVAGTSFDYVKIGANVAPGAATGSATLDSIASTAVAAGSASQFNPPDVPNTVVAGAVTLDTVNFAGGLTGTTLALSSFSGRAVNGGTATLVGFPSTAATGGKVVDGVVDFPVASRVFSGNFLTVNTAGAHDFSTGDTVTLASNDPLIAGTYTLTAAASPSLTFSRVFNVPITRKQLAGSTALTLTTATAHNLAAGDTVTLGGIDGVFNVGPLTATATASNVFTVTRAAAVTAAITNVSFTNLTGQATFTCNNAHNLGVGDTVTLSGLAGQGAKFNLAGVTVAGVTATNVFTISYTNAPVVVIKSLSANTATLVTLFAHGLAVNDVVVISGLGAPFDGTRLLTAAAGSSLSFAVTSADYAATAVVPAGAVTLAGVLPLTQAGTVTLNAVPDTALGAGPLMTLVTSTAAAPADSLATLDISPAKTGTGLARVPVGNLVRLNADGSLDLNFLQNVGSGANGQVRAVAVNTNTGDIFVGGDLTGGFSVNLTNKAFASGSVATFVSSRPHGLTAGAAVTIAGVDNILDGNHRVAGVLDARTFTVATNYARSIDQKSLANNTATLRTTAAHNLVPGMTVAVSGVDNLFDGTYTVVGVPAANTFTFDRNVTASVTNREFAAGTITFVTSGAHNMVAGNQVTITGVGGLFNGSYSIISVPANNQIVLTTNHVMTATTKFLTNNVAVLTTSVAHGLEPGYAVTIAGVDADFNGAVTVAATPATNVFTYVVTKPSGSVTNKSLAGTTATVKTDAPHGLSSGNTVTVTNVDPVFDGVYGPITVTAADTFTYARTFTAGVSSRAASGGTATIVTATPHRLASGYTVTLAGVGGVFDGGPHTATVVDASTFTFPLAASATVNNKAHALDVTTLTTSAAHNFLPGDQVIVSGVDSFFNGTYTAAAGTAGSTLVITRPRSFAIAKTAFAGGNAATITTTAAHGLAVNDRVNVTGVNGVFDGVPYTISSVPSATSFTYARTYNVAPNQRGMTNNVVTLGTATAHNLSVGDTILISGFTGADTLLNGTYTVAGTPTSTSFTYAKPFSASITTKAFASGTTATITTAGDHDLAVNDLVTVSGVDAVFNGTYTVASTPTLNTFTYAPVVGSGIITNKSFAGGNAATFRTTAAHKLAVGNTVNITGLDAAYNGSATVTAVDVPNNTFTVTKTLSRTPTLRGISSNEVTIVTSAAHNLAVGDTVQVALTTPDPTFDGAATVTAVFDSTTFAYARNFTATVANKAHDGTVATLITSAAHGFVAGQNLDIAGVDAIFNGSSVTLIAGTTGSTLKYNRPLAYQVNQKSLSGGSATVQTTAGHELAVGANVTVAIGDPVFDGTYPVTGVTGNTVSYARTPSATVTQKAFSGTTATLTAAGHNLVAGNTVVVSGVDGIFDGTYVVSGVAVNDFSFSRPTSFSVNQKALTNTTVTVTTETPHNFANGYLVTVTGVDANFINSAGSVAITVTSPTNFTYTRTPGAVNLTRKSLFGATATLRANAAHNLLPGYQVTIAGAGGVLNGSRTIVDVPNSTDFTFSVPTYTVTPTLKQYTHGTTTVMLTAAGHALEVGNTIVVSGEGAPFDGTYVISAVGANDFSYISTGTADIGSTAASGSASVTLTTIGNTTFAGTATPTIIPQTVVSPVGTATLNTINTTAVSGGTPVAALSVVPSTAVTPAANQVVLASVASTASSGSASLFVDLAASGGGTVTLQTSPAAIPGAVLSVTNKARDTGVATLSTSTAHGYRVGESVTVSISDAAFDGVKTITALLSANTFSYVNAGGDTTAAASGTVTNTTGTSTLQTVPSTTVSPAGLAAYTISSATAISGTPAAALQTHPEAASSGTVYFTVPSAASGGTVTFSQVATTPGGGTMQLSGVPSLPVSPAGQTFYTVPSQVTGGTVTLNTVASNAVSPAGSIHVDTVTLAGVAPNGTMALQTIPSTVISPPGTATFNVGRLAKFNSSGTLDTAFNENLGTGLNAGVRAITLDAAGNLLVGGDFAGAGQFGVPVTNRALTNLTATITTTSPHGYAPGASVAVSGVDPRLDGTYTATGATASTIDYLAAKSLTITNRNVTAGVATFTTDAPHGLAVGNRVAINGVSLRLDGAYVVTTVPTPTTFTVAAFYQATINGGSFSGGTATINTVAAHGFNSGEQVLVSGANNIFDTAVATITVTGPNQFTYPKVATFTPTTKALAGGNTITIVTPVAHGLNNGDTITTTGIAGPFNSGPASVTVVSPTSFSFTKAGMTAAVSQRQLTGGTTVTLTTSAAHGLAPTANVDITGVNRAFMNVAGANVVSTPTATTFTYTVGAQVTTLASVQRDGTLGIATNVTAGAHNLQTGDTVTVNAVDNTFDAANVPITVINGTTYTYANAGADSPSTADAGTVTLRAIAAGASGAATATYNSVPASSAAGGTVTVNTSFPPALGGTATIIVPGAAGAITASGQLNLFTGVNNKSLSLGVAELTTTNAHGLQVNDRVTVSGVDATFNGTYAVTAVTATNKFRYALVASDVPSTAVSPVGLVTLELPSAAVSPAGTVSHTVTRLARISASGVMDESFNNNIGAGPGSTVRNIALNPVTGEIYVGGDFTGSSFAVAVTNKLLAANVATLTTPTPHGLVAGSRVTVANVGAPFDGALLTVTTVPSVTTFSYAVVAADVVSQAVSPAGTLTRQAGEVVRLTSGGVVDGAFNPGGVGLGVGSLSNLVVQADGSVVLGGSFRSYNGATVIPVIRLTTNGTLDTSFNVAGGPGGTTSNITSMVLSPNGALVLAGTFTTFGTVGNTNANGLVRLVGDYASLTIVDDELNNIPAGSADTVFAVGAGANGPVQAAVLQSASQMIVGGDFTQFNSVSRARLARVTSGGVLDTTFLTGAGFNDTVRALAVDASGRIVAGGSFTNVNGTNRNFIVRLNSDGGTDSSFNPGAGADNPVYAVGLYTNLTDTVNLGRSVIGGAFATFNGVPRLGVARLNTNGTLDTTFDIGTGANGTIFAVAVQSDGKVLVGGDFTTFNGTNRGGIIRLNVDGSVDTAFNSGQAGANGSVRAITVQSDGKVLIGGLFTTYNGTTNNFLARLESNGQLDNNFTTGVSPGADNAVYSIALQDDGKIIVAGDFTRCNGVTRSRVTRLNPDGAVDPSINFGTGANGFVAAALLQPVSGFQQIVLGGGFTTFNGASANYITRLNGGTLAGSGRLEFTAASYSVSEAGGSLPITIVRGGGTTGSATSTLAVVGGTATNGVNYLLPALGTNLVFPEGEVVRVVNIPITNDTQVNVDRTISLVLSNFLAVAPGNQTNATITIVNDDTQIGFTSSTYSVNENVVGGFVAINVTRTGSTVGSASADFLTSAGPTNSATVGADYTAINTVLTFASGESLKTVNIPILDDSAVEGNETVTLVLTNITGAAGITTATLTIVENDFLPGELNFLTNAFTVSEAGGSAVITVVRSNGFTGVVSVNYATTGLGTAVAGVDYTPTSGTLAFADGQISRTFSVPILVNVGSTNNTTVSLQLNTPTGGAIVNQGAATLTIVNNDVVFGNFNFITNAYSAFETNTAAQVGGTYVTLVGVSRDGGNTNAVSVSVVLANGSATNGIHYNAAVTNVLTWAHAESGVKTFAITNTDNVVINDPRTLTMTLTNATGGASVGGTNTASFTILDDEIAPGEFLFAQPVFTVLENAGSAPITILRTNGFTQVTTPVGVTLATGDGTATNGLEYTGVSTNLVFTNGQTSATVLVPILDNGIVAGNKIVNLTLSAPTGGATIQVPASTTLTIVDNDPIAGSVDSGFNPGTGPNAAVNAIGTNAAGQLIIAGDFNRYNNLPQTNVARLLSSGALDTALLVPPMANGGAAASLLAMVVQPDGRMIIGGQLTTIAGVARQNLARINTNGTLDLTFDPPGGAGSVVNALALQGNGRVIVGGNFTTIAGGSRNFVARLNTNGTLDTTFDPGFGANGIVHAVAVDSSGNVLVGGAFTTFNGVPQRRLVRLTSTGALDGTFNTGTNLSGQVNALLVQPDGKILIGGGFTNYGATARAYVARLNSDGSLDTTFNPGAALNSYVSALGLLPDGRVVVAGGFTSFNGVSRNYIAILTSGGALDPTSNLGTGASSYVTAVQVQSDTKVVLGGGFTSFNGVAANYLARINTGVNLGSGTIGFSAANYDIAENSGSITITVVRSAGTSNAVQVAYTTANGTAGSPTNYLTSSGTLTFAEGETLRTFNVSIVDEGQPATNAPRTINLLLSTNVNTAPALLGAANATITIQDRDAQLAFAASDFVASESGNLATIIVVRTGSTNGQVSVDYTTVAGGTATAGVDYTATSGTLTFADGVTSQTFNVAVLDDGLVEGSETVVLALTNAVGQGTIGAVLNPALSTATLTITDDDFSPGQIGFSTGAYFVSETAGSQVITVVRTNGTQGTVSVSYATANNTATAGADYVATSGSLVWASGDNAPKTFTVTILDDTAVEGNETINLTLTNASVGVVITGGSAVLTIQDNDDQVQFTATAVSFFESASNAVLTVQRVGGGNGLVTVDYTTVQNGSAVAGTDFTATNGTLTFNPGVNSQTVVVPITNDQGTNLAKTFSVQLGNQVGASLPGLGSVAQVTILDDDSLLQFATNAVSVSESAGSVTLNVTRTGASNSVVSVQYATTTNGTATNTTDYVSTNGTLVFATNVTSATVTVQLLNDAIVEADETFTVALTAPTGESSLGAFTTNTVTILNDDNIVQFAIGTYSVVERNGSVTLTIVRTGASNGVVTVPFTSASVTAFAGTDFVATNGTLTFGTNVVATNLVVTVLNDTLIESGETFTVTLGPPTGESTLGPTNSATISIVDDESTLEFALTGVSVLESAGTLAVQVTRTGALDSAVTVPFSFINGSATNGVDFNGTPGTLTFGIGTNQQAVNVTIANDLIVEPNKTFSIVLGTPGGEAVLGTRTVVNATILDDDSVIQFPSATLNVSESAQNVSVSVLRTGATNVSVSVNLSTADGLAQPALSTADYGGLTNDIVFAIGESLKSAIISLTNDSIAEGTETFRVMLNSVTGQATLGTLTNLTVQITDDDFRTLIAAGHALVAESYQPTNSAVDPLETVTVNFSLRNIGNVPSPDITATLLVSGGVSYAGGPQSQVYTNMTNGAVQTMPFTFTAAQVQTVTATLQLSDSNGPAGTVSFPIDLGVASSFSNRTLINIPGTITVPSFGPASPYPNAITVTNVTGLVNKVTVRLHGFSHSWPADVDILLVGPGGQKVVLMSDAGSGNSVNNLTLTFDDAASSTLPELTTILEGTFRPTDYAPADSFPAPAPAGPYSTSLSVFNGSNPTGTWTLYIVDDTDQNIGSILTGWSLHLSTVSPLINLTASMTNSSATVIAPGLVTFTTTITNQGPNGASSVVYSNVLPAGLTFVSTTNSAGSSFTVVGSTVAGNLGPLGTGAVHTVTLTASTSGNGLLTNTAVVFSSSEVELVVADNTAASVVGVTSGLLGLTGQALGGGGISLTLTNAVTGRTYVFEGTTNFVTPTASTVWLPLVTNLATGSTLSITNSDAGGFLRRFYRAIER